MFQSTFKSSLIILVLFFTSLCQSFAQEKAFQIDFEKNVEFESAIYSQTGGAWIWAMQQSLIKKKVQFLLMKYSPDFSKKEWEKTITMGSFTGAPLYYKPNPSYLYFFDESMGLTAFNKNNFSLMQISPKGDAVARELADDKTLKYLLMGFCDSLHFYQLAAKSNPGEFVLIKYAHDTWKNSKVSLQLPAAAGGINEDAEWHLSGRMDKTISFIRYGEKKAAGIYQLATFDIASGKIINKFIYTYGAENPTLVESRNIRVDDGERVPSADLSGKFNTETKEKMASNGRSVFDYSEAALGLITPALDGIHYYFVSAVTHKPTKLKLGAVFIEKPDGYIVQKLDKTGKVIWKEIYKFTSAETGGIVNNMPNTNSIYINQSDFEKGQIAVQYSFPEAMGMTGIKNQRLLSYLYDEKGKKLESYLSDSEIRRKVLEGKEKPTASNMKHFTIAHRPKLSKAILEYGQKKGIAGNYLFQTSGNNAALFITPKGDEAVLGVVYFKAL